MGLVIAGFIWGLAEATLFFLVPDILLTWVVLRKPDRIVHCYIATLAGAVLGGIIMYLWGSFYPMQVNHILDYVPAVSPELIRDTQTTLAEQGWSAMFIGAFNGVPFKLYAANAATAGIGLLPFIMCSIPARLARWITSGIAAYLLQKYVVNTLQTRTVIIIFVIVWVLFYAVYFFVMPN